MFGIPTSKLDVVISLVIIILLILMLYNNRRGGSVLKEEPLELGVQDLVEHVKVELVKAEQKRIDTGQAPLFELKDFELEINFVVTAKSGDSGSVDFKVVTLGGETNISSEKIQKIKLHMTAVQPQAMQGKASATPPEVDESIIISEPPPKEDK